MRQRVPHARTSVGHLSRQRRLTVYGVSTGVWLTGTLWLVFHYFFKQADSFGFSNPNPSEKWWLTSHALLSFYAIWLFGLLWTTHVKASWRMRVRRGTGGTLFAFTAWLAISGCALYYIVSDAWRWWMSLLHWVAGLGGIVVFAIHLLTRTPRVRARG